MIDSVSIKITGTEKTAAADDLFSMGNDKKLDKDRADECHTAVAKEKVCLFVREPVPMSNPLSRHSCVRELKRQTNLIAIIEIS